MPRDSQMVAVRVDLVPSSTAEAFGSREHHVFGCWVVALVGIANRGLQVWLRVLSTELVVFLGPNID